MSTDPHDVLRAARALARRLPYQQAGALAQLIDAIPDPVARIPDTQVALEIAARLRFVVSTGAISAHFAVGLSAHADQLAGDEVSR